MSSGLVDIYDEYREYRALCEKMAEHPVRVLPLGGYEQWVKHWEELKRKDCQQTGTDGISPGIPRARLQSRTMKAMPLTIRPPT